MSDRVLRLVARTVVACLLTTLVGSASAAVPAGALETNTLGIAPVGEQDNFHVGLLPGEKAEREAVVSNLTNDTHHVSVYPVDATVTAQGGFALGERASTPTGVGAWAHLPIAELSLAPHSKTSVRFALNVPADAAPGDYAGGIVIETDPVGRPQDVGNQFSFEMNLVERIGVRVYLNVAGKSVRTLQVGKLTWERSKEGIDFHLPITNTGNMRLAPDTQIALKGRGMPGHVEVSRLETLLPGSTVTVTARWRKPPLIANGTATATVNFEGGPPVQRSTDVRIVPVLLMGGVLIGVAGLLVMAWRLARFLRKARQALRLADERNGATISG